ncbi:hypothetical protein [Nonomuraea wenchangensis]|uniref:hypothetical protein n=1 Tax=Nonomuraea wenchangensis TaxID=568860 RepID=UPI00333020E4
MSSMRRAKCRVCDKDSALNQDELVHPHGPHGSRCRGSHRPPAGEPPCAFCGRMVGRVAWPEVYDPDRPHASTYVCYDPEHQREARLWVKTVTGHEGVFYGRETAVGGAR